MIFQRIKLNCRHWISGKCLAFTLIEMMVVVSIIIILSVIGIANLRGGKENTVVEVASCKLSQDLRDTKNMAMSSEKFDTTVPRGGYGVFFGDISDGDDDPDRRKYNIFADCDVDGVYNTDGDAADCEEAYNTENSIDEFVKEIKIEPGVQIQDLGVFIDGGTETISTDSLRIIFIPPDPDVIICDADDVYEDGDCDNKVEGSIILVSEDDSSRNKKVTINKAGLIEITTVN